MANNSLTFSSPVQANLSWKVKFGGEELENVDSLVLNINNKKDSIAGDVRERTVQIDETTTFYLDTQYENYSARSGKLHVKIIGGGVYYGSVQVSSSDEWDVIKSEIELWIRGLDQTILDSLTDSEPIIKNNITIAHPGKLVKVNIPETYVPYNKEYHFYGADADVDSSHPILIYPKAYGELDNIKDALNSEMYNKITSDNSNSNGFMKGEVMIGGIGHYIYIQKMPTSNDAELGVLTYSFNKN